MQYILLFFLIFLTSLYGSLEKITYPFSSEPIDVVIPCALKDQEMLTHCIDGVRKYGQNIRRIIVVSKTKLTSDAEWFSEENYPFTKEDLARQIFHGNKKKAVKFLNRKHSRIGWIFQQFLKLYAPFVIPNISSNVLIVDADVVFIKPTSFMNEKGEPFFNTAEEYHAPYFEHMQRVLADLHRVDSSLSGVTHHMLFQKPILEDLFSLIDKQHNLPAWKVLCRQIDEQYLNYSSLSEYEIYFNFALLRTDQAHLRKLRFRNISSYEELKKQKNPKYDYVTYHNYL